MSSIILCFFASNESTSSDVEYCPVLVFFGFSTNFNFSNNTTPNCFGEDRLKDSPAFSKIIFSIFFISLFRSISISPKNFESKLNPSVSIFDKILINGNSTSFKSFSF